jgi:hypothetical protein
MRNYTVYVLLRHEHVEGSVETQPCEVGWANEAIFYLTVHENHALSDPIIVQAQISPDGINWVDNETSPLIITDLGLHYMKLHDFGGWLRVTIKGDGKPLKCVMTTQLSLKE